MKKWYRSVKAAIQGIKEAGSQTNIRIQSWLFISTIILSFVVQINRFEWFIILVISAMVFAMEMINTAIELLCDKITMDHDEDIRRIKDIAAGAVLTTSIFAVITGTLIFVPRIWHLFV